MFLFAIALATLPAATAAHKPGSTAAPKTCARTVPYYAYKPGQPLQPRKLTELPPATAYMAVLRHIGPCEVPLTMVDYRNPRRP